MCLLIRLYSWNAISGEQPLNPQRGGHVDCESRAFFNVVEMCSYICICFYIGFTRSKTLTKPNCAAFRRKHDSARYRELSFFRFPLEKHTVVKQLIHNWGRANWKPTRYARLCSAHFEESCFEVDTFSSTNGSRSVKTSTTENVKVWSGTIFHPGGYKQTLDQENCQIGRRLVNNKWMDYLAK